MEDYHTYYVGENEVWEHNANYNDSAPKTNDILKDKNIKETKSKFLLQFDDLSGDGYNLGKLSLASKAAGDIYSFSRGTIPQLLPRLMTGQAPY